MIFQEDYLSGIVGGVEYLMALGSIIGVLGIVLGLLACWAGGPRQRARFYSVIFVSLMLIIVCGATTGFKYFRIR